MSEKTEEKVNEDSKPKPGFKRLLKLAATCIILAAAAITGTVATYCYITQRQLDAVVIKTAQAGEPVTFHDLLTQNSRAVTDQDAAKYYSIAFQGIAKNNPQNIAKALTNINKIYRQNMALSRTDEIPAELRDNTASNLKAFGPILENLDKAAQLPVSSFEFGFLQGIEIGQSNIGLARLAVHLSSLRTLDLILAGQSDAAASSAITTCKITRVFDTYPIILVQTIKLLSLSTAAADAQLMLMYGQASEPMLAKLQEAISKMITTDTLERTFQAERAYQIEIGANLFSNKVASKYLLNKASNLSYRLSQSRLFWRRARMRQLVARHFKDLIWLVTTASQPWPGSMDKIMDNISDSEKKPGKFILQGAKHAQIARGAFITTNCTILAIAIQRYQRTHNQLPESLDNLIDTYIGSIPLDPFTGDNLLYIHDDESFTVYSTSLNHTDDGGVIQSPAAGQRPPDWGLKIKISQKN